MKVSTDPAGSRSRRAQQDRHSASTIEASLQCLSLTLSLVKSRPRVLCRCCGCAQTFNIKPTELQVAFPPPPVADGAAAPSISALVPLAEDPLLLAVIGRISTKV